MTDGLGVTCEWVLVVVDDGGRRAGVVRARVNILFFNLRFKRHISAVAERTISDLGFCKALLVEVRVVSHSGGSSMRIKWWCENSDQLPTGRNLL